MARWFSWLEHQPVHQKVSLIPDQITYLIMASIPGLDTYGEATNGFHSLSLSSLFFLKSINIFSGEDIIYNYNIYIIYICIYI